MRDALEEPLSDSIKEAVQRFGRDLIEFYTQETSARFAAIAASLEAQWEEWESSVSGMPSATDSDESWKAVPQRLHALHQALL